MTGRSVFLKHLLFGVPLAALANSIVHFAAEGRPDARELPFFALHVLLGMLAGSVVLAPAYAGQGALVIALAARGAPRGLLVIGSALLQASLAGAFALLVGLEPSLPGRFPITPAVVSAGATVGALVAWIATRPRRPLD